MSEEDYRRDPESILKALKKEEDSKTKGRLKVFLGMCPGVGKTYAMLEAAEKLLEEKNNVVIGVVETHDRKETEDLLKNFNIIPRKSIDYRKVKLNEMDLDTILALDPAPNYVLVDELAHQNAPGSRHEKRYQDIQELLAQGYNVYTTVNIQHIESLNDKVAQITGIIVHETVPDSFFDAVDELELVDISTQVLLKRLDEGKVYLGARAAKARENFFQEERLTALRELALRFTAEIVDQSLSHQMTLKGIHQSWNVNEKLLVAVGSNPNSTKLIRAARRIAYVMDTTWIALSVDTGIPMRAENKKNLEQNLDLAKELGAEIVNVVNVNMIKAIAKVCADRGITQIIMGRPDRRYISDFFSGGNLLNQIVKHIKNVDIHVLQTSNNKPALGISLPKFKIASSLFSYIITAIGSLATILIFHNLIPYLGFHAVSFAYFICILLIAISTNIGPTMLSATIFSISWLLLYPEISTRLSFWQDSLIILAFYIVAFCGGLLINRLRRQEELMANRESRTSLLYEFNRKINSLQDIGEINNYCKSTINNILKSECSVMFADKNGELKFDFNELNLDEKNQAVASWAFNNQKTAGKFTSTLAATDCICYPLVENSDSIGVLIIIPNHAIDDISTEDDNLIQTITKQLASSVGKIILSQDINKIDDLEDTKSLQQRIIKILSVKFKPGLTQISSLINSLTSDQSVINSVKSSLQKINKRLSIIIENILNLANLESEGVSLQLERVNLVDFFTEVLTLLPQEGVDKRVLLDTVNDVEIIGDYTLLKNAFINILDNALLYSHGRVYVSWQQSNDEVDISIKDEGQSQNPLDSLDSNKEQGMGLELVTKVVDLHKGRLHLQEFKKGFGLDILISLPMQAEL